MNCIVDVLYWSQMCNFLTIKIFLDNLQPHFVSMDKLTKQWTELRQYAFKHSGFEMEEHHTQGH